VDYANKNVKQETLELVEIVDELSQETKDLALNLALYLAKARSTDDSGQLRRLEPDFIRLVNGTVRVVQELTHILNAARNQGKMVYQLPSGQLTKDHIEARLETIVHQCNRILGTLVQVKDLLA
jgi:hypothetical protein